jgi:chemotaxis methyl-accepting protein methylase
MVASDPTVPVPWAGLEKLPDMDDRLFEQWVSLLRERTGMAMPRERKSFLVTSIGLRMREIGYQDYGAYYEYLTSGVAGNIEWMALVDRLTVHETRFFRDPRSLEYVERECLPQMIQRVRRNEHVQVWSAGCATGEEAFTFAMLIDSALMEAGVPASFGVIGTDISLYSLATAREGIYAERRIKQVPERFRHRYCERLEVGSFRMADRLRRRICFAQFNIRDVSTTPPGNMDLVFCQNVLIYFERESRLRILEGLVRPLRVGGSLVLGAGEVIGWEHPHMVRAGKPDVLAFKRVKE